MVERSTENRKVRRFDPGPRHQNPFAQQRRRLRRRYLGWVHARWLAAGAPRAHSRPEQIARTVALLVLPGLLAVVGLAALWLLPELPPSSPSPVSALVLVPLLAFWLLLRARH